MRSGIACSDLKTPPGRCQRRSRSRCRDPIRGWGDRESDVRPALEPNQNDLKETVMAATPKETVSSEPINRRPSSAQRRAAESASLSNQQARLKQEAADRRAQRAKALQTGSASPRARRA